MSVLRTLLLNCIAGSYSSLMHGMLATSATLEARDVSGRACGRDPEGVAETPPAAATKEKGGDQKKASTGWGRGVLFLAPGRPEREDDAVYGVGISSQGWSARPRGDAPCLHVCVFFSFFFCWSGWCFARRVSRRSCTELTALPHSAPGFRG